MIETDDLRTCLAEYQSKNNSRRVTIDNIHRILSSFFAWLEDEDLACNDDFELQEIAKSVYEESLRIEAAFFESVRVLVMRLMNQGEGKKTSLPEMNARINALLEQSIKSSGVINLFSDVKGDFSLFDPNFLEEIGKMKEKNLAVELLKKLISEQVILYKRTNVEMRMMIKKLLKKHRYPPEGMDDAVLTVMLQCELWTDNHDMGGRVETCATRLGPYAAVYSMDAEPPLKAAEDPLTYG